MECMTKFVEQGDYLVIGQKCWLACSRLWNVEVVTYNGKLSKKEVLIDEVIHPSTTAL